MKLVLDERLKHRLIGLAVILSLMAIFAPAIMKKSAQHMDRDMGMRLQMPAKPGLPDVAVVKKKEVFQSVKVAHVKLPDLPPTRVEPIETRLASIEMPDLKDRQPVLETTVASLPKPAVRDQALEKVSEKMPKAQIAASKKTPEKRVPIKPVPVSKLIANSKPVYSVQLASFAHRENALVLVNKLKNKGYIARIDKISGKKGDQYKVFVGKSNEREQALKLKNQLALGMQLHGFIVTGAG